MSTSKKQFNDLQIVISRVDDICKFLNNMKKAEKSMKQRLDIMESNIKSIEQKEVLTSSTKEQQLNVLEKKVTDLEKRSQEVTKNEVIQLTKRLEKIESTVAENNEKIKNIELDAEATNSESTKERELEQITSKMKILNQGIKQEINDLERYH